MIHPDTRLVFVSDDVGYGVFATRPIPRGTVVWMHDALDHVFTVEQAAALPEALRLQVDRFSHIDTDGDLVMCWDHGRYINHACRPSTTSIGTLLEITRRDLAPGDELTCEYGFGHFREPFTCTCGAPDCRGAAKPGSMETIWARWNEESAEAFAAALRVEQPVLRAFTEGQAGAWIIRALRDRTHVNLPVWGVASAADWRDGPGR